MDDELLAELKNGILQQDTDRPIGAKKTISRPVRVGSSTAELFTESEETAIVDDVPVTVNSRGHFWLGCGCVKTDLESFVAVDKYGASVCETHLKFCLKCRSPVASHNSIQIGEEFYCKSHGRRARVLLVVTCLVSAVLNLLKALVGLPKNEPLRPPSD